MTLGDEKILEWIMADTDTCSTTTPIGIEDLHLENSADELVDADIDVVKDYFTTDAWCAIKQSGTMCVR